MEAGAKTYAIDPANSPPESHSHESIWKKKLQVARVAEKLDNLLSPLAKKDDEIDDLLTGVDRRRPGNGIIIGESRYGRDLIFSFYFFCLPIGCR